MTKEGDVSTDTEVLERLTRIEVKLDAAMSRGDDHETRIRRLERVVWIAAGAAATGGGLLGSIIQQMTGG
jgi:hypothetical protein